MQRLKRMVIWGLQRLLYFYKSCISPYLPMSCRFYPSCSSYAWLALEHYGIVKGLWKTMGRLLRCHPWSEGGYDPVLSDFNKEKY